MDAHSRYSISDNEAGLEKGVLRNKLGIKDQAALDNAELVLFHDAYQHYFEKGDFGGLSFNSSLLFSIHAFALSTLYDWAGKVRTINMSKNGTLFAPVAHLSSALKEFDLLLKKSLPTSSDSKKAVAQKIAEIHNEYNAIHPFRDGNGRAVRLFIDLMVASIGYDFVDWGPKKKYLTACAAGMAVDHAPMTAVAYRGLKKK